MGIRPRTVASTKRRVGVKKGRKAKKYESKVMPMLSRPKSR